MISSVRLPKMVAIQNQRLALIHHFFYFSTLVILIWYNYILGHSAYAQIPISVQIGIHWDESETIQGMEDFFAKNPVLEQVCRQAPYTNYSTAERWGYVWPRRVACTSICTVDSVIDHSTWDSVWNAPSPVADTSVGSCWADFGSVGLKQRYTALQFMHSYGEQDVIITSCKNDWIVDHRLRTRVNNVEAVPQAKAAVLRVGYSYALLSEPGWFPSAQQKTMTSMTGSNTNAKTVIVDAHKNPVRVIEPGGDIKLTVDEVTAWFNAPIPPETYAQQAATGAQFNLVVNCFGSNLDIDQHFGRDVLPSYEPTLVEPVCTLEAVMASSFYQVDVNYVIPEGVQSSAVEIVSETTGFYFKGMPGQGFASVWDGRALLISLSSMLVFLALPRRVTATVAARMLGPLSEMYRRAIVEPYDIERAAAAAATVLAANMSAFRTLSRPSNKSGTGAPPNAESAGIPAIVIQKMLAEAMESRASAIDDMELASLACFVYEGLHQKAKKTSVVGSTLADILGIDSDFLGGESDSQCVEMKSMESMRRGITLDEWNQVRFEGEKITFDAAVKLFDKDRHRRFLETFFTPPNIKKALARAVGASALIPELSASLDLVREHIGWNLPRIDHSNADDSRSDSAPCVEGDGTPQSACADRRFEVDPPGMELEPEPLASEVPLFDETRRELLLISSRLQAAEETLRTALGKGLLPMGAEEAPMVTMGAPMLEDMVVPARSGFATSMLTEEARRELFKACGASSGGEPVRTPAARVSSDHCLEVEVSARPLHRAGASARAWCEEALPAPHTDAGARHSSAEVVAEQGPSLPKPRLAEEPALPQAGEDSLFAMPGALRKVPEFADEYSGLPIGALKGIGLSKFAS